MRNPSYVLMGCLLLLATSCEGVFEGIYDKPSTDTPSLSGQQLVIDATSWGDWYYVDFDSLHQLAVNGDSAALLRAQTHFTPYRIPMMEEANPAHPQTGIYTYWFDVFGKGISVCEKRGFMPTASQPEPNSWSIAVHRNNVRTNGGAAIETHYTSMDELPPNSTAFTGADFREDEWSENEVWADESHMLSSLVGCQGIKINKVLSSWLRIDIPPMPPAFTRNSHIYIIRLRNGKYAAVQLENYMNDKGVKCWLTVNYKYPY